MRLHLVQLKTISLKMDEKGCRVFQSAGLPPRKRRKIETNEAEDSRDLRRQIGRKAWTRQQHSIDVRHQYSWQNFWANENRALSEMRTLRL